MDQSYRKQATFGAKRPKSAKPPPPTAPPQYPYAPGPYSASSQLFDDTSASSYSNIYPQVPQAGMDNWNQNYNPMQQFPGQQLLTDPMAAMAMQYGQTIAGQGKIMVEEKIEKYVSLSKMKYYFAVDTGYVIKKLSLLFFPFTHKQWAVHQNSQSEPLPPRYDINAPDLYIPSMAFVTYILITGYILGSQNRKKCLHIEENSNLKTKGSKGIGRFTPEQLGIQASSALGWSVVEIFFLFLALYLLNAASSMKILDLISFCSYKYVCMVATLLACIFFKSTGYYIFLGYSSFSLGFFLLRTLRMFILPKTTSDHYGGTGRHSSYLLLGICVVQPLLMYILTKHLITNTEETVL